MIVNLRGTSGSGKSYIVRQIMDLCGGQLNFARIHEEGRKQPIGYVSLDKPKLFIPGHYETPCGGCDTIHGNDKIFDLIRQYADSGYNVLFEGLLITVEYHRTVALSRDHSLAVLAIDIPLKECIDSINARRKAKNPDALPVKTKNTTNKWKQMKRTVVRLKQAKVKCFTGDREEVFQQAKGLLNFVV